MLDWLNLGKVSSRILFFVRLNLNLEPCHLQPKTKKCFSFELHCIKKISKTYIRHLVTINGGDNCFVFVNIWWKTLYGTLPVIILYLCFINIFVKLLYSHQITVYTICLVAIKLQRAWANWPRLYLNLVLSFCLMLRRMQHVCLSFIKFWACSNWFNN